MHLQVSVSRIDELRRVMSEDWASEAQLIESIKAPTPLGWQALYGEALHACIEDPDAWRASDGYMYTSSRDGRSASWPAEVVDACLSAWPKPCLFECDARKDYRAGADTVTVTARIDAAHGNFIVEGKTRFGSVDPLNYADSLQWRFYLDMHPWARSIEYRVHEIGGMYADPATGELRISRNDVSLKEIHVFRLWPQADLSEGLTRWAAEFAAWAKSRGLTQYLQPRAPRVVIP